MIVARKKLTKEAINENYRKFYIYWNTAKL